MIVAPSTVIEPALLLISGVIAPITEYPADVFRRVVDVHVMGAFYMLKHGLPRLRGGGESN